MNSYSVSYHTADYSGWAIVSSDTVISECLKAGMPTPSHLADIVAHGCSYSGQDFDAMSSAIHSLAKHLSITERGLVDRIAKVEPKGVR